MLCVLPSADQPKEVGNFCEILGDLLERWFFLRNDPADVDGDGNGDDTEETICRR